MTISVLRRTAGIASVCLVLVLCVAACGKKKVVAAAPPPPAPPAAPARPPAPPPPPPPPPAAAAPRVPTEAEIFASMSMGDVNKNLGDVYFELDAATLKEEGKATLSTNATYLKKWMSIRLNIEGHCDERGSAEYNLGLGERRANATKDYLVSLGIAADRVTVVSKGKEAGFCSESNEACWAQNRRGHVVVTAK